VQITEPESHKLEVIVEDSQLSLAIGKKGQNVRLASKLIGWDIDIKSEEEKRREIEDQMNALTAPTTPLTALAGVGAKTIEKIEAAGITNVEKLAGMTPEQLMEIPGIGEKMVDKIYQAVNRFYESGGEAAAATGEATAEGEEVAVEGGDSAETAETEEAAEGDATSEANSASNAADEDLTADEVAAREANSNNQEAVAEATPAPEEGDVEKPEEAKS
jgi:N utilization substance protein A